MYGLDVHSATHSSFPVHLVAPMKYGPGVGAHPQGSGTCWRVLHIREPWARVGSKITEAVHPCLPSALSGPGLY